MNWRQLVLLAIALLVVAVLAWLPGVLGNGERPHLPGRASLWRQPPVEGSAPGEGAGSAQGQGVAQDFSLDRLDLLFIHAAPRVVSLRVLKESPGSRGPTGDGEDGADPDKLSPDPQSYVMASGSGILVQTPQGVHVLTAAHVVDKARVIQVVFGTDDVVSAAVVGTDPQTDISLLRLDHEPLTTVRTLPLHPQPLHQVKAGHWVVAVGGGDGRNRVMARGVVSGAGARLTASRLRVPLLMTDVSLAPGFSGGPLLDMQGRVVGMITARAAPLGNAADYSPAGHTYAIPMEIASAVVERLLSDGRVVRPRIGLSIRPVSEANAVKLGLHDQYCGATGAGAGALVTRVLDGGPAAVAGLEEGDVIRRFAEHQIRSVEDLRWRVELAVPGEPVELRLRRGTLDLARTIVPASPPPSGQDGHVHGRTPGP